MVEDEETGHILPKEEDKCDFWEWVDLDTLIERVRTKKQKEWIPLEQVIFYLKQMWGDHELGNKKH